jgi:hypothetical protein
MPESKNPVIFIIDIALKDYLAMACCNATRETDTLHCSSSPLEYVLRIENPFGNNKTMNRRLLPFMLLKNSNMEQ